MNEGKSTHGNEGLVRDRVRRRHGPYWRRAHRDWRFWLGTVLVLAVIAIYVLSDDLAFLPRGRPPQALPTKPGA